MPTSQMFHSTKPTLFRRLYQWKDTPGAALTTNRTPAATAVDTAKGAVLAALRTSGWHCGRTHNVDEGVVAALAHLGLGGAALSLSRGGSRVGVIDQTISIFRAVPADGRELLMRATVPREIGEFLPCTGEVTDADANVVALAHQRHPD